MESKEKTKERKKFESTIFHTALIILLEILWLYETIWKKREKVKTKMCFAGVSFFSCLDTFPRNWCTDRK